MLKQALKAVIGVGTKEEPENITPGGILFFALLVAVLFLGTVSLLLLIASFIVNNT